MRILSLLLALSLVPAHLLADQVTNLGALHRSGQTFITWTTPPGQGWTYRLYSAASPIFIPANLDTATLIGSVGDSTWCNRRLSRIRGVIYGYSIDSLAAPLDSTRGLFVVTPATAGTSFYAVTVQASQPEDRSVAPGQNSMLTPVIEIPERPRHVYQRTILTHGVNQEIYTLWTSPTDTPDFPAMANRHGAAYDCGITRGGTNPAQWHAMFIHFHVRGGNCANSAGGTGTPGEWILAPDDFTRNSGDNTWWFGYHPTYDIEGSGGTPPTSGAVVDYTRRRVGFTIEWALANFPVDRTRIYASGGSMGGIGAVMFSFWRPDLIAAAFAHVPRANFAAPDDPNSFLPPTLVCQFNADQGQRVTCDRLWGTRVTNLPGPGGWPAHDWMNGEVLADWRASDGIPPIMVFSGRRDGTIGWSEKPPFYEAMERNRHGGIIYWDERDHTGSHPSAWQPMVQPTYLYRFRLDRSYPALSNCSANHDPGDGTLATGDSVGVINAFVEWDTLVTDTPEQWQTHLTLRDLTSMWGPVPAPDSLTVDVTPRRLQQFAVTTGGTYRYEVRRSSDNAVILTGSVPADALGLITVPSVPVYKSGGSLLTINPDPGIVDVPATTGTGRWLSLAQNPVRSHLDIIVRWPTTGPAELALFDLSGRRQQILFQETADAVRMRVRGRVDSLSPGVYFVRAWQAGVTAVARVAIVR